MPSQKNLDRLQELSDKIASSKAVIFTDYSGLSMADQTELRQKIAETGGTFSVSKNTLLRIILKGKFKELPDEVDTILNGPTAVVIADEDAVSSTKALAEFIKDHERPSIKIGLMEDKVLTVEDVTALSKLPGREQLLATLLAQLNAPAQNLVGVLSASMRNLVYVLQAINTQKGGEQS